jgi:hypothetical protein
LLGIGEGDALVGEIKGMTLLGVTDGEAVGDIECSGAVVTRATLDSVGVLGISDACIGVLVGDVEEAVMIDGEVLGASEGDGNGTLEGDKLGDT